MDSKEYNIFNSLPEVCILNIEKYLTIIDLLKIKKIFPRYNCIEGIRKVDQELKLIRSINICHDSIIFFDTEGKRIINYNFVKSIDKNLSDIKIVLKLCSNEIERLAINMHNNESDVVLYGALLDAINKNCKNIKIFVLAVNKNFHFNEFQIENLNFYLLKYLNNSVNIEIVLIGNFKLSNFFTINHKLTPNLKSFTAIDCEFESLNAENNYKLKLVENNVENLFTQIGNIL